MVHGKRGLGRVRLERPVNVVSFLLRQNGPGSADLFRKWVSGIGMCISSAQVPHECDNRSRSYSDLDCVVLPVGRITPPPTIWTPHMSVKMRNELWIECTWDSASDEEDDPFFKLPHLE